MSKPDVKFGAWDLRVSKHPFGSSADAPHIDVGSVPVTLSTCLRHTEKRGLILFPRAHV